MSTIIFLRSFRIFKIALFDIIMSLLGLYLLGTVLFSGKPRHVYMLWSAIFVLPISIIVHYLIGTPTMLNYYLGISPLPPLNQQ